MLSLDFNEKDLFKLCKRKRLKESEKELLVSYPHLTNGVGETLFHNYMKHDGCDIDLLNKFVENNCDLYNINRSGEDVFKSCYLYCRDNTFKKLNWLLDQNYIVKKEIGQFLFDEFENYPCHRNQILNIIKRIQPMIKEVKITAHYRGCQTVDDISYFKNNFNITYTIEDPDCSLLNLEIAILKYVLSTHLLTQEEANETYCMCFHHLRCNDKEEILYIIDFIKIFLEYYKPTSLILSKKFYSVWEDVFSDCYNDNTYQHKGFIFAYNTLEILRNTEESKKFVEEIKQYSYKKYYNKIYEIIDKETNLFRLF